MTRAEADPGPTQATLTDATGAPLQIQSRKARPPLLLAGFCAIVWAVGSGLVVLGVSLIALGASLGVSIGAPPGTNWGAVGLFFAAQGALVLFAGLGLWRRRPWAWSLAWILSVVEFQTAWPDGPIRVAVSVSLLPYLFAASPSVKWPTPAVRVPGESWTSRARASIGGRPRFSGVEMAAMTLAMVGGRVVGGSAMLSLLYKGVIVSLFLIVGLCAVALFARVWDLAGPQRALKP